MDSKEETIFIDPTLFIELKKENEKLKKENDILKRDNQQLKANHKLLMKLNNKIIEDAQLKADKFKKCSLILKNINETLYTIKCKYGLDNKNKVIIHDLREAIHDQLQ